MMHDGGEKTVLSKAGNLSADDVLDVIAFSRQSARFITSKLWQFFAGSPPSPALQEALADEFERHGREFRPLLKTVFLSSEFHDEAVVRKQIKSPVQFLVAACRQLECPLPPAPVPSMALRLLGQELFHPPSVKGWDGGAAWINTNTLLNRHNLTLLLVEGQNVLPIPVPGPMIKNPGGRLNRHSITMPADPYTLMTESDLATPEAIIRAMERRFLQTSLTPGSRAIVADFLKTRGKTVNADLLTAIRLLLCTPEYQLT